MRLEWLPTAERDLDLQIVRIAEHNLRAAIDLGDAIELAVRHLRDHPHLGRSGRVSGTRELVVGGTPYIVAYRLEAEAVVVLRVLHGAQQWPAAL